MRVVRQGPRGRLGGRGSRPRDRGAGRSTGSRGAARPPPTAPRRCRRGGAPGAGRAVAGPSRCRGPSGRGRRTAAGSPGRSPCSTSSSARVRASRATCRSEPACRKPSTLPRRCSPWPPQLPAVSSGTVIRSYCGRAVAVVVVDERVGADLGPEVDPVGGELLVGEALVAADQLPGDRVPRSALPQAVLDRLDLLVVPVLPERRQDAAVVRGVAVEVARPLPHADRPQVGRLGGGDQPLVHAEVGDPESPTLPSDHGSAAAHSMQSWKSWVSREKWSTIPGERPQPRESTRTIA